MLLNVSPESVAPHLFPSLVPELDCFPRESRVNSSHLLVKRLTQCEGISSLIDVNPLHIVVSSGWVQANGVNLTFCVYILCVYDIKLCVLSVLSLHSKHSFIYRLNAMLCLWTWIHCSIFCCRMKTASKLFQNCFKTVLKLFFGLDYNQNPFLKTIDFICLTIHVRNKLSDIESKLWVYSVWR